MRRQLRRSVARVVCVLAAALLLRQAVWAGWRPLQVAYLVACAVLFVVSWGPARWAGVQHSTWVVNSNSSAFVRQGGS